MYKLTNGFKPVNVPCAQSDLVTVLLTAGTRVNVRLILEEPKITSGWTAGDMRLFLRLGEAGVIYRWESRKERSGYKLPGVVEMLPHYVIRSWRRKTSELPSKSAKAGWAPQVGGGVCTLALPLSWHSSILTPTTLKMGQGSWAVWRTACFCFHCHANTAKPVRLEDFAIFWGCKLAASPLNSVCKQNVPEF